MKGINVKMLTENNISEIIKGIAEQKGVTEDEVYADLQTAINIGFHNLDPAIQEYWSKINPDGEKPTPEKLIEILAKEIQKINK